MVLKQSTNVGIVVESRRSPLPYVQISRNSYCCMHVLLRVLRYVRVKGRLFYGP
jgi:hypothetical protein